MRGVFVTFEPLNQSAFHLFCTFLPLFCTQIVYNALFRIKITQFHWCKINKYSAIRRPLEDEQQDNNRFLTEVNCSLEIMIVKLLITVV